MGQKKKSGARGKPMGQKKKRGARSKILLYDIESSPNIGYTWGKWEQNVIEFVEERQGICFSWKWLGDKETHFLGLPDFPGYKKDPRNNRALIIRLHELFEEAEIIIGH